MRPILALRALVARFNNRQLGTMSSLPRFGIWELTDVAEEQHVLSGKCHVEGLGLRRFDSIPDAVGRLDYIGLFDRTELNAARLAKLTNCKLIVVMGTGYDTVDIQAAGQLGIPVCNIPTYCTEEVADTAMAHILALYRQTVSLSRLVRSGHVVQRLDAAKHTLPVARRLRDSVLGLVGVGAIGSRIATRAQAFGVHVVFHDPVVPDSTAQTLNIERAKSLQHLASISDCVSINCPLTLGTTNLIGRDFISHMKRGSFLVNTSRGRVVNEPCVIEGLRSGQLGGCALDVTELEPVTQFHPLVRMDSAIITPHTAWYSQESLHELRSTAAQIVLDHITQSKLRNVVNQQYLP